MDGSHFGTGVDLIDVSHLTRQTMGDRTLTRDILIMFRTHLSDLLTDLQHAETLSMWRLAAHTLKGTAYTIGAKPLGDVAARAESLGRAEALIDLNKDSQIRLQILEELFALAQATDRRIVGLIKVL